jgi:tetratricopeptide (TPR) repeat protein
VTYREPTVVDAIHERFAPVQINTQEESARPLIERYRQAWTPDVRVLAPDGYEMYRWNGYLPPFEFAAQLLVAQGQALLRMGDLDRAAGVYEAVLTRFPTSAVAAEAQYYRTVARYKASHERNDLSAGWDQLQSRYPESIWRTKQSFRESQ